MDGACLSSKKTPRVLVSLDSCSSTIPTRFFLGYFQPGGRIFVGDSRQDSPSSLRTITGAVIAICLSFVVYRYSGDARQTFISGNEHHNAYEPARRTLGREAFIRVILTKLCDIERVIYLPGFSS